MWCNTTKLTSPALSVLILVLLKPFAVFRAKRELSAAVAVLLVASTNHKLVCGPLHSGWQTAINAHQWAVSEGSMRCTQHFSSNFRNFPNDYCIFSQLSTLITEI